MKKTKRKAKAKVTVVKAARYAPRRAAAPDVYTVTEKDGLFYLQNIARKEQDLGPFSTLAKASEFAKNANGRIRANLGILG
jgi:hypothetical protein